MKSINLKKILLLFVMLNIDDVMNIHVNLHQVSNNSLIQSHLWMLLLFTNLKCLIF